MITIKSVEQNVNNLCKTSVKPIDCKSVFTLKKKSMYKCFWPNCRFETDTFWNFEKHKPIHFNERLFVCNFSECNKTFNFKSNLYRHKRTHSGEKPFKCDINGCGKRFTQKSHLIHHKRIQSILSTKTL